MKVHKLSIYLFIASAFLMITACGGGGGESTGTGEVTMSITDAKPLLPEGAENVEHLWINITEVLVHKSGGDWESLTLNKDPFEVDLLLLVEGVTDELVPPVELDSGKYTQIRLVIDSATIVFPNDTEVPVEIPSGNLKTDRNFDFDVENGGVSDIIIDFDLSQSLVVTGPSETPSYKLKPVLHIVDASEAATISGAIDNNSFEGENSAIVTVFYFKSDQASPGGGEYEEYTKVVVSKDVTSPSPTPSPNPSQPPPTTGFSIYWVVPNVPPNDYKVEIDFNHDGICDLSEEGIFLDKGDDYTLELAQCN